MKPGPNKMMPRALFALHELRAAIECEVIGIAVAEAKDRKHREESCGGEGCIHFLMKDQ